MTLDLPIKINDYETVTIMKLTTEKQSIGAWLHETHLRMHTCNYTCTHTHIRMYMYTHNYNVAT